MNIIKGQLHFGAVKGSDLGKCKAGVVLHVTVQKKTPTFWDRPGTLTKSVCFFCKERCPFSDTSNNKVKSYERTLRK